MRIIFAGTPVFARVALQQLMAAHEISLVLTPPDRPRGRGLKTWPSPVKELAVSQGLPVLQPSSLQAPGLADTLAAYHAEVIVVAAYGMILPPWLLAMPRFGCINIHASLLPRWRGAAPIVHALLAGDQSTGISIMQMDAGLDTGPVLMQAALAIAPQDTAQSLHDRLASLGAELIVDALHKIQVGPVTAMAQNEAAATYAAKISKADAKLGWILPAEHLERAVRAYNPYPVAELPFRNSSIKVWRASLISGLNGEPGTLLGVNSEGFVVACGRDALQIEELQQSGGRRLTARAFLAGHSISVGEHVAT